LIDYIVVFTLTLMFPAPAFFAQGQETATTKSLDSCLERIDIIDKNIFKKDDNLVKILGDISSDNKEGCDFVKYLQEAHQENILSPLLDLIDPQKRLNIFIVKDSLKQKMEIYLRDSCYGTTKDTSLLNRCIVVLGGYYQLRNYSYDHKIFMSWMKKSLKNNRINNDKENALRYVFPYVKPDKSEVGIEKKRMHYWVGLSSQDARKALAPDYLFIVNHTMGENRLNIVIPCKDEIKDGKRMHGEYYDKNINIYPESKELKNELQLLLFPVCAIHFIFSI
jgi:hypothetical protein